MKQANTAVRQRKTTDIRQSEIVKATIRIIANEGPRNFTAKRVADEVGITSGAVFRHFETMADIVDQAAEYIGALLSEDFPTGIDDPLKRLRVFFLNRTKTIVKHPHISRLLLSDHLAQAGGAKSGTRLDSFKRRSRAFVVECLSEIRREERLAPGVEPEPAALVVLGAILALSHSGTRAVRCVETERLSMEVWGALEGLLKKKPTTRRSKPME